MQSILNRHGIDRVLASEGGRTWRGSIGNMREYVAFLNALAEEGPSISTPSSISGSSAFTSSSPPTLQDQARRLESLRTVVRDVIEQAEERQKTTPGVYYAGAVMQHLVGAKLDCALGKGHFEHNSFSTADAPSARAGDFFLGDVAIHVTTSPGEAVINAAATTSTTAPAHSVTLQRG